MNLPPQSTTDLLNARPAVAMLPQVPDHDLMRRIGSGSYGEVWLARNSLGTLRAVKIVRRAAFDDERPYEREFAGIRKFEPISRSHEGFVDLLQVGRSDANGYFYYVMELADDANVGQASSLSGPRGNSQVETGATPILRYTPLTLAAEVKACGALPLDECFRIARTLVSALAELHRYGLVHRDIKPSNIIFVDGVPKLADIGLVASANEARSFVGTEGFIPPEGPGTPQADLYSLGIVLYVISTGKSHRDFPEPPANLASRSDRERWLELQAIIHRACQADPHQRYPNAEALRADLDRLISGKSVKANHAWRQRARLGWNLALTAAVIALVGVGFRSLRNGPTLPVAGGSNVTETFATSGTTNREAFSLYLQGRECRKEDTPDGHVRGIRHFEQAVALDPNFAPAYAEVASAWSRLDMLEHTAPRICRPKSRDAALRALALDDRLVAAHVALGSYKLNYEWDWEGAERDYLKAASLAPNDPSPRGSRAFLLSITGRHDEAIQIMRVLQRERPAVMWINNALGDCLFFAGRLEEAEREVRKTLEIARNNSIARFRLAEILWSMGCHDEAISEWEQFSFLWGQPLNVPGAFARSHDALRRSGLPGFWRVFNEDDTEQLRNLKPDGWFPPMNCVWTYAGMGELDKAFEWIERACEDRQPLLTSVAVHPHYAALWPDPRFKALLKRMGLDRYFPERMWEAGVNSSRP